ncbi:endopeptidase La [Hydrocarboniphaga sp.]|uniref:endopeptidase La n=1 Tax=Hydrocarboniphaga sp. TaxID=2033016 RepID=UPI003D0A63A9
MNETLQSPSNANRGPLNAESATASSNNSGSQRAANPPHTELPDDAIILLPVRNMVLFPGMVLPLALGRDWAVAAAQEAARTQRPVGVLLQKDPQTDAPGDDELYRVGTVATILRLVTARDGKHHLVLQGEQRFRVVEFLKDLPFAAARIERIPDLNISSTEIEAQFHTLKQRALEAIQLLPDAAAEMLPAVQAIESPGQLADFVAGYLDIKPAEKQEYLETFDILKRLQKLQWLLAHRVEVLRLSRDIGQQTKDTMEKRQREFMLREQLKTIQKELGDDDDDNGAADLEHLAQAISDAGMPEDVEKQARKELKRLRGMGNGGGGEASMLRTYLDTLVELPWSKLGGHGVDVTKAREILDGDHFGLAKIKRRILEFLAVQKLNPQGRSPILCFVGPPGVGKTSLGQSIAKATGRAFQRVSLGGTHDEAEIRGHRRTYMGSLPGNIIQALRKAGTRDPVIMLDEIDKLGAGGFHGDPSSALLEVLDPEQNGTFRDNYLGLPFDLSKVMFIATANQLDTIPGPLRDRMEIIQLSGYTAAEKLQIARRYLIERQRKANGLLAEQAQVTEAALTEIVEHYTRESGVRSLEREIGTVFRSAAMKIAEGTAENVTIDREQLHEILGQPHYENEVAQRTSVPGVATGLAWTPVGGDILFIEASRVPGSGHLQLTGQLGDVMKESAQAAWTLVKSRHAELGLDIDRLAKSDIHVHVPAGATPKDGPSAGVAMFTALASLLMDRNVRADVAMTGEISLRGLVLPVGGIKEKVIAAHRAGIRKVLLPARNKRDLDDIPPDVREALEFVWLDTVDQAVVNAIEARQPQTA